MTRNWKTQKRKPETPEAPNAKAAGSKRQRRKLTGVSLHNSPEDLTHRARAVLQAPGWPTSRQPAEGRERKPEHQATCPGRLPPPLSAPPLTWGLGLRYLPSVLTRVCYLATQHRGASATSSEPGSKASGKIGPRPFSRGESFHRMGLQHHPLCSQTNPLGGSRSF